MQALVKRGRELAAIGNCNDCHTVRGGKSFAGGLPVPTPFGTIYSSNITPDAETGIGRWPEAAFRRAMRSGVNREGQHLYPTFPYDHFTNVSDEDDAALYAYLMTRPPVQRACPRKPAVVSARPASRGRGLEIAVPASRDLSAGSVRRARNGIAAPIWSKGLAHCGACHTPRNVLGAERASASFAGGDVDNWNAFAINAQSPSPVPWNAEALFAYLRDGSHPDHGVARGPMAEVVSNLSSVPESDVRAIATYMAGVFGAPTAGSQASRAIRCWRTPNRPSVIAACSYLPRRLRRPVPPAHRSTPRLAPTCHETDRALPYGGVNLGLSTAISAPDARNVANIVLSGVRPVEGERSPIMPGFASQHERRPDCRFVELSARALQQPTGMDRR